MDPTSLDLVVRAVAYPVAGAIFLNQVEELVFDVTYLAKRLHRRERRLLKLEELRAAPQLRVAIIVPAWHEAAVIEQMLDHNVATLDYDTSRYDIFVGTYPNDPETAERVDAAASRHPNVHRVRVPHDGPTSKADCLNWVWRSVVAEERRRGTRFDAVVLHDAEDVIHPLALRLYSKVIPEKGAVQIPVFSLDRRLRDLVAGTYVDEFSEFHLKELAVRDSVGGLVPSAGVGTAFARELFERLAGVGQEPFDPTNLTEDYDLALRLRLQGKGLHFVCHTVEDGVHDDGFGRPGCREEYIATREYFPHAAGASVKQRARWICGIALQAWERFGWQGPREVRYSLWRDRKGLANGLLVAFAYLLVLYLAARCAIAGWIGSPWCLGEVIPPGSLLELILQLNLFGLAWRALWKFHFVRTLYGWRHGLLALPRLIVANFIVIAATARAVRLYARHRLLDEPLRWAKTDHAFPESAAAPPLAVEQAVPAELLAQAAAVVPLESPAAAGARASSPGASTVPARAAAPAGGSVSVAVASRQGGTH